jgi:hypothetical protein
MKSFGKLEKVDLHELWYGESSDFTPWLSEEENIVELGNIIGMELVVQDKEQKSGPLQADILCRDVVSGQLVLIGSQLDPADSPHLGQLITTAAGLEASTLIWIAKEFSTEHIAALNWLNTVAHDSVKLFGLVIEAYKIGDSLPAPDFNIVAKPSGWTKQFDKSSTAKKLTDTEILELEYWHGLKNFMEENKSFVKLLGTPPKSWFNTSRDKGRYFLSVTVNPRDISLNIWLNIIGEKAKDDFDRLYEVAYNNSLVEINQDLMWNKMQAKAGCAITLKAYADFMERNDWTNQYAWFKENLEKFDRYFRPRIKELQN